MWENSVLGLLFITAALLGLLATRAILAVLFRPRPAAGPAAAEEPTARGELFGGWTQAVGMLIPMRRAGQEAVRKGLLKAGFYHPSALADYRAVRSLLALFPMIFGLELALLWDDRGAVLTTAGYGLLAGLIGFSLPRVWLVRRGEQRSRRIRRDLPMALDLLALCLTAGVNLLDALRHVGRQLRATHPVLAGELLLTHRQAELRSLGHALICLADRVQTPEASTAAYTLAQAEELGTNTSAALEELAASLRTRLRQDAEAQANRTSFWMLFPSTGCLYVAAAILLIGPAALQMIQGGNETQQTIADTKKLIEQANKPVVLPGFGTPAAPAPRRP